MIASDVKLHVRLDGRSFDLPLADLHLGTDSRDREIKNRLAEYLEVTPARLNDHRIDRHANGNVTLRPNAIYG